MFETISLRRPFNLKNWPVLPDEHWTRRNVGTTNEWALLKSGSLQGLGLKLEQRGSEAVVNMQITLPTMAYGTPSAKIGSLEPEALEEGLVNGIGQAKFLLPDCLPKKIRFEDYDVKRYDSNITLKPKTPNPGYLNRLISAMGQEAIAHSSRKHHAQIYASDSLTVYNGKRGSKLMDRMYDKTTEATGQGFSNVPEGLLRMESEHRTDGSMTVAEWAQVQEAIALDDRERLAKMFTQASTTMTRIVADMLLAGQKELGEKPNPAEAMELATVSLILQEAGVASLIAFGYTKPTAYRKRARVQALTEAVGEKFMDYSIYDYWNTQTWLFSEEAADTVESPKD